MPQSPILLSEENSDDESNEVDQEDLQLMFDDDFYEESHIAIEDGEVSLDQITILSKAVYHPLSTLYLEHCVVLPDYPKTDPHGYTYCINVEGQKNPTNIDIQYSFKKIHPPKSMTCTYLGNIRGKKIKLGCTAIKHCEFVYNFFKSYSHISLSENDWTLIQQKRNQIDRTEPDKRKRNSNSLLIGAQHRFRTGVACEEQNDTCSLVFRQLVTPDMAGICHPYLSCSNSTIQTMSRHFMKYLPPNGEFDTGHLRSLIENGVPVEQEECGVVEQQSTRRPTCGIDHPQGPGKLVSASCGVTFHIFIPDDLSTTPYVLFTSHGVHTHVPPPPNKAPKRILEEITHLIRRIRDPDLTLAKFLRSDSLKEFCRKYDSQSLVQIHNSFATMDRISVLIQKEKLLSYPEGKHFAGLLFEQRQSHQDPTTAYIQKIYDDRDGIMAICFLNQQAEVFLKQTHFEIDMSFKRIRQKDLNEIIFAAWLKDHGKVFTLARVLVNTSNPQTYTLCFIRVFNLISQILQRPIKWFHLDGEGFETVTVDMCWKQLKGFGRYLESIDPERRSWRWQVKKTIIFCRVHFQRSIDRAAGTDRASYSVHQRMASLLTCQSQPQYMELCDLLIENENEKIVQWAKQKKIDVIAAGLNKHCSLIRRETYDYIRNHTNTVEQSANKSYSVGKRQDLLPAIRASKELDQRDVDQYFAREKYGTYHTQRSNQMSARYKDHMGREKRKRENKEKSLLTTADEDDEDIDDDNTSETALSLSSSTRGSRQKSSSLRGRSKRSRLNLREDSLSSAEPSSTQTIPLRQNTLNRQQELEDVRARLELRRLEAEIEEKELSNARRTLENEKLELEIVTKRQTLQRLEGED